jgi:hypothetical protein
MPQQQLNDDIRLTYIQLRKFKYEIFTSNNFCHIPYHYSPSKTGYDFSFYVHKDPEHIFDEKKSKRSVVPNIFADEKEKRKFRSQSGQVLLCYCALLCMFLTSSSHRKYFITQQRVIIIKAISLSDSASKICEL